ncbi:MAG: prepilin-type N-terminal cleavage/methylation domain-containing protein [Bacilli bacterium]
MKQKGFTLIELLAVIVILAIIALIATPMILGVIDSAKKGAAESSAYGYIDAVEKSDLQEMIDSGSYQTKKDGTYDLNTIGLVNYKGNKPSSICVTMKDGNVESGTFKFNSYIVEYKNGKAKVNSELKEITCEVTASDSAFNTAKGVNAPQVVSGMTPIKWVNGVETVTTVDDPDWYDYNNKSWANVKTKDGSYFVWIPRYAYKITSGYHSSTTGTIDVKFLKGTSDEAVDGTSIKSSGYVAGTNDTSMNYFTHPTFQNNNNELGFWVAKFEPTAVEGVANGYISDWGCPVAGDNVATKTIKVIPSVNSWRCINISNAYKASLAMKDNATYGWTSSSVDTHVATNLEWGAIYYLTLSSYGANTNEVYINNNQNYITGCAGDTASTSTSTLTTCKNPYDSEIGVKASTTWNITGVYDMSGGAWERTMSVYNNLLADSGFTTEDYNNLPSSHITKYTTPTNNLLNNVGMDYDATVYGDGVYETSTGAYRYNGTAWSGTYQGGWSTEYSYLPYASSPWFVRGACFYQTSIAGLGGFSYSSGGAVSSVSFRPVVSSLQ